MSLRELGEFGFIERIRRQALGDDAVLVGIGDDAAALAVTPGRSLLVTTDLLAEGIHFDRTLTDPRRLGRKTLAVNLSDLAAMGARPRFFLVSLAVPRDLDLAFLETFMAGLLEMARRYGVALVGGDTCGSAGGFTVSVTLMGEREPGRTIVRGGARAGDAVYVTGVLGDSALGLRLLRRGIRTGGAVDRHLDPVPRVEAGHALAEAGIPTAMIDVSDGIAGDAGHLARASGVALEIDVSRLPLSEEFRTAIPPGDPDRWRLALQGGEDYELLFTAPPAREGEAAALCAALSLPLTRIGEVTAGSGTSFRDRLSGQVIATAGAFDHFSGGN